MCPGCKAIVSWPREVQSGQVIGICPHCGYRKNDERPTYIPDQRGRPRHPGPWKDTS